MGIQDDIDQLISASGRRIDFEPLDEEGGATGSSDSNQESGDELQRRNLGLVRDVPVRVRVELGRSRLRLQDVLRLAQGSVVELDKLAGDALDIYVNDRLVAKGEVLVLNENFCIRITDVCVPKDAEELET